MCFFKKKIGPVVYEWRFDQKMFMHEGQQTPDKDPSQKTSFEHKMLR